MSQYAPFLVALLLLGSMTALAARNRRRAIDAQAERAAAIRVGTEVMTTSGLYGTVVHKNGDDTVQLSIAPGVEVRWELAALRDVPDHAKHLDSSEDERRRHDTG